MILNDVSQLQFPVMCLWDRFVRVRTTVERLTVTKMAGLRHGMFRDMLIVDSNGNQILVADARKKCGYGWLWGWNLFLNQRIRVKLELTSLQHEVGMEELKTRLRSFFSFIHRQNQCTFERIAAATTSAELIGLLVELGYADENFARK